MDCCLINYSIKIQCKKELQQNNRKHKMQNRQPQHSECIRYIRNERQLRQQAESHRDKLQRLFQGHGRVPTRVPLRKLKMAITMMMRKDFKYLTPS